MPSSIPTRIELDITDNQTETFTADNKTPDSSEFYQVPN